MQISPEHTQLESQLMVKPHKHNAIILFRRLFKGIKLTPKDRFEKFKEYLDNLVERKVITQDWATKWKGVNPWGTRPGQLE